MIEKSHPRLSVGAQCRLLSISRSSFYYAPQGETAMNLDLMLLIDQQFLDTPFYGVRQMTWHLQNEGHAVNQKRVRRLMRLMRLMPIYQKPDTSRPAKGHKTYPYLLGGLRVDRPNQVWCADITYIPMRRGFLYLVAIMDWFTRKVLAWRISNIEPWSATGSRTMARGSRLLRRGAERGDPQVRPTRDHEYRSRLSVHVLCLD
jgi:putative transposase